MNKKKIILISSIALILIIAIICVVVFGKDKSSSKDNNETTSKVTEVTSTETDTETNSEKETESTTEESTTEQPTTEKSTVEEPSSNKELETYLDENGVPHIKVEETTKGNGKFTYTQDIQTVDDAREYFKSLGYKVSNPVTASEIREIYKDFPNVATSKELEEALALDAGLTLVELAMRTLPSNPNKPDKEQATTGSSNVVIDSYYKPEKETTKKEQSSNEEETTSGRDIDTPMYERDPNMFDELTSEDNIFD